jgi:hypothetical protein
MTQNRQTNNTTDPVRTPRAGGPATYPLVLTEEELIDVLRIGEVSRAKDLHHVVENLRRMHGLPCIHICRTPLYPFEAVRQWITDKVDKE